MRMSILNKNLFLLFFLLSAGACVHSEAPVTRAEKEIESRTHQRIYFSSFESLWRAAQLALRYPISVNNMDEGIIETDWISGGDGFFPAHITPRNINYRYRLRLLFAKGKTQGRSSIRVTIVKDLEIPKGFFTDSKPLESDGIEEVILFYRIERELTIDEAIKKESKKSNKDFQR